MTDAEYQRAVVERDGRCLWCGRGGEGLTAHHIIHRRHQKARHDMRNGITLCYDCHIRRHHLQNKPTNDDFITVLAERGIVTEDGFRKMRLEAMR